MAAQLLYYDIERENEGDERIPVAHDNYLKSVVSLRQSAAKVIFVCYSSDHRVNVGTAFFRD